ncbi:MAG: HD domain-containing phosphohydrolase [Candidatus Omnitrophota bacterium]
MSKITNSMPGGSQIIDSHIFQDFVEKILEKKDIDSFLKVLIEGLIDIFDAERATFYFYNEETRELWSYIATDLETGKVRVRLGEGIVGRAAAEKKIIVIKEARKCPYFNAEVDKKTGFYTHSVLASPLLNRDKALLGAIQILNKKQGYFSDHDIHFLKSICCYIVVAMENIRLLQEKESLLRSTIYALTGAIDAKDPVTAGHSYRVTYFSLKIGRALGLSEKEITTLEYSAYLHDVGKIGISDIILQKKERLLPAEYALIKKHPEYTKQILNNILFSPENKDIPDIAAAHHEFLDGSGYPQGLKDKQINLLSRIIAVADVYDALVSFDRPYKKHLTEKQAKEILENEADKKHLDKKIVGLFINKGLYRYERRRHQRVELNVEVDYRIIPQRKMFREKIADKQKASISDLNSLKLSPTHSKDISGGGVFLFLKNYLPIGTYLDLEIKISSCLLKCIGKVVWIEKWPGTTDYKAGVSFINLSEMMKDKLAEELSRLTGK